MKKSSVILAIFLSAPVLTGTVHSQTFTSGTFTDDAILSSVGPAANEVAGADFGAGPTERIDGYALTSTSSPGSGSRISISGDDGDYNGFLGGNGYGTLTTTGNSDFDSVVGTGTYNTNATESLTITGLAPGKYEALILSDDDRSGLGNNNNTLTLTDNGKTSDSVDDVFPGGTGGSSSPGADTNQFEGAYLTDTFRVPLGETGHVITIGGSFTGTGGYVNAVLVEAAAPEPSTYGFMLLGMAALVWMLCRRSGGTEAR